MDKKVTQKHKSWLTLLCIEEIPSFNCDIETEKSSSLARASNVSDEEIQVNTESDPSNAK